MQRLFRKSSIRILRKKNNYFIYSHCFHIVSLTILSKILIKTFNGKILRYIKIYLNLLPLKVFNSIFIFYINIYLNYRFCQQNSMKMSLSTCSEFGLQVYLLNYMKIAGLYMSASLSIDKWKPGMFLQLIHFL